MPCFTSGSDAHSMRAIVMRESLAAPFVHSNELGDRQASPPLYVSAE